MTLEIGIQSVTGLTIRRRNEEVWDCQYLSTMRIVYSESLSFVILYNPVTYSLEYQQDTERYPRSGCLHYLKVVPCRSVQSGCLTLHATWCYEIHKIISVTWYYVTLKWPRYIRTQILWWSVTELDLNRRNHFVLRHHHHWISDHEFFLVFLSFKFFWTIQIGHQTMLRSLL